MRFQLTDADSRLILSLLAQIPDGASLILLRDKWYAEGRFKLAASLSGIIENRYESQYSHIVFNINRCTLTANSGRLCCCSKSPMRSTTSLFKMCPVYNYSEDSRAYSLSDFFLWLCDHFGDDIDMLDAFSSNMGTFSFCGNEISAMYASRIPLFEPLLSHSKGTVRSWRKINMVKRLIDQICCTSCL